VGIGIEEFYFPEAQRHRIAEDLSRNVDKARVEIKVDRGGQSALERLTIEDRIYEMTIFVGRDTPSAVQGTRIEGS